MPKYQRTVFACFVSTVVLAIVNSFVPLLFVTFQREYAISLGEIAVLISVNFGVQTLADLSSAKFIDKIGYRASILIAHATAAVGLSLLPCLPQIIDPFTGIMISTAIYAVGGGIIEVLGSPILEGCPAENKATAMSLMHSFYCWGQVGVVLLSSLFFNIVGTEHWMWLALIWAAIPIVNGILFINAPIVPLNADGEPGMGIRQLLRSKVFYALLILAFCTGAGGEAVGQWVSVFAEHGLHMSKSISDLAGPMVFAALMGTSRAIYGKIGQRINLTKFMLINGFLCVIAYVMTGLIHSPILNLLGSALCGFSIGIMWPGTFRRALEALPAGGTAMFALLALFGDFGAVAGPALVGKVADLTGSMHSGILAATVFPAMLLMCLLLLPNTPKLNERIGHLL